MSASRGIQPDPVGQSIGREHRTAQPIGPRSPGRATSLLALQLAVHALVAILCAIVAVRALLEPGGADIPALAVDALLLLVYFAGPATAPAARRGTRWPLHGWLLTLTALWIVLMALRPEAAYLVFPLFFCYLHLLRPAVGVTAVLATTLIAIAMIGTREGWSVGGVLGPLIGAAVALMIGLGFRLLRRQAEAREELLAELLATQRRLAETEREAGIQAERTRLAREIHDTVAQGLSSIQMLLHAAERADPESPGVEHVRLARETAASDLAETRRFIRELTPPALEEEGLAAALRRLADGQWARSGLAVRARVADEAYLPMDLQTALLRLAQGAIANVVQHAHASTATIELTRGPDGLTLVVADDGVGFDPGSRRAGRSDSFGLRAAAERVSQLGGTLAVDSAPGAGTRVVAELPLAPSAGLVDPAAQAHAPSSSAERAGPASEAHGPSPSVPMSEDHLSSPRTTEGRSLTAPALDDRFPSPPSPATKEADR